MSHLSVKTKNDTSPQGKPRVYFSCHPADFEEYFETICADIFATQDCAIYYETDWENVAAEGDLKSRLSDMQLFVVPITTKFLTKECRAKSFEYAFAMEQHIPVLPIAMEGGLAEIFPEIMNRVGDGYGDIQFLDRTSTDTTEIPYAEKLKNRLESVLIGNELAERVRAAFDAYIFLSYRKKDREKAKELMNLIHRIPYCRDIAIWYDEFLVPGEAWNQAIADALNKSKLVTLMVTPSIIEPGNFIIEHEYPDAIAAGKEVLPAEVVPTEREALFNFFEGISMPFDGRDEAVLAEKLKSIAVTENDNSPEHNYLIGLAYLGAVDVERNPERAVELITSAAEAGLPEAMEKLSDMYDSGEGVERNYYMAAEWMERCCEALEEADPLSNEYIAALLKCGQLWANDYQPEQAFNIFLKMLDACEARFNNSGDVKDKQQWAISLRKVGQVYAEEGFMQYAEDCYIAAADLMEEVFAELETPETMRELSIAYERMGDICSSFKRMSDALYYYEKSLEYSKLVREQSDGPRALGDIAIGYDKVGDVLLAEGRVDEAEKYYRDAEVIRISLEKELQTAESKMHMAVSLYKLACVYENVGDYDAAIDCIKRSIQIRLDITKETDTFSSKEDLISDYGYMGALHRESGKTREARQYLTQAVEMANSLVKAVSTLSVKRLLFILYIDYAEACRADGDAAEERRYIEAALKNAEQLVAETDTINEKNNLFVAYSEMGRWHLENSRSEEALNYLHRAMNIIQQLADETGMESFRVSLARTYSMIAEAYGKMCNSSMEIEYMERAFSIVVELAMDSENLEVRLCVAEWSLTLGGMYIQADRYKEADTLLRKGKELNMQLFQQTNDRSYIEAVSSIEELLKLISPMVN